MKIKEQQKREDLEAILMSPMLEDIDYGTVWRNCKIQEPLPKITIAIIVNTNLSMRDLSQMILT